ncbi:MAG: hypothetical protein Q4B40_00075 [Clostridia bacterium]|nr:hypothetical protein [Clostridia bacterium]
MGSNPLRRAKNRLASASLFFIQADRLGISSRVSVYIIAAIAAYIITPLGVYKKLSA